MRDERVIGMASEGTQAGRPKAGLPRFQAVVLRYVQFPIYCRFTSWKKAAAVFEAEGNKLIALAHPLSPDLFQKTVQIGPLWGLEDNSRCWSAEMVLEHLIEVGSRIAIGIVELSHGEQPSVKADDLKPKGGHGLRLLKDYIAFLDDYAQTLLEDVGQKTSNLTHPHPWFGQLTAHGWACFGAVHLTVHRRQMERIVTGLEP
ncbi:MAG: DinB family protein [Planctomycetes bacterium]|nr:DinB family protein [Planctomycetota bacterium]